MAVIFGIWFATAGCLAALAGLAGMRRAARLRRHGVSAWAMAVRSPGAVHEAPGRPLIQYAVEGGRVIERSCPQSAGGAATTLQPGQQMLVWYDPADPHDVLVHGREGRRADRAFVAAGLLLIGVGAVIAALGL